MHQAQSPTAATPNASTSIVPESLRQLPESVRQALHGCVAAAGTASTERGAHLTIYIASADPAGIIKMKRILCTGADE